MGEMAVLCGNAECIGVPLLGLEKQSVSIFVPSFLNLMQRYV